MRGGFVEQQQRRVLQVSAGDGDALGLAAGQAVAALTDLGVQTGRQPGGELVKPGGSGGGGDLVGGSLRPGE